MADEFTLQGAEEVMARLRGLSQDARYKGGRFALRKGAQVVRDAARSGAKRLDDSQTGRSIDANIVERWNGRLFKQTGDLGFRVGVLQGAVLPKTGDKPDLSAGGPTPHFRLLEFGTEKMAARPFLRPALENNAQAVAAVFMVELNKSIDRALKRAAKGT